MRAFLAGTAAMSAARLRLGWHGIISAFWHLNLSDDVMFISFRLVEPMTAFLNSHGIEAA
jgi:hypothetical protein